MFNIVLIGMPGSGKTSLGKEMANLLEMDFVDLDELIEKNEKLTITELFQKGELHFRDLEEKYIDYVSKNYKNSIISTGGGAVLREKNMENLKTNGKLIFINRDPNLILSDLNSSNSNDRPLLMDKNKIFSLYNERINLYKKYMDYEFINNLNFESSVISLYNLILSMRKDYLNETI